MLRLISLSAMLLIVIIAAYVMLDIKASLEDASIVPTTDTIIRPYCEEDEVIIGTGDYRGPSIGWGGYACKAADDL